MSLLSQTDIKIVLFAVPDITASRYPLLTLHFSATHTQRAGFMKKRSQPIRKLPQHWPSHLRYITVSHHHSSVTPSILAHIKAPLNEKGVNSKPAGRPKVVIKGIRNTSHPANGQFGLFAAQKIAPRTHILDYIGEIHCDERPDSDYDLSLCRLPDGISIGIDASAMGNEARFVNDYRGISDRPNAVFLEGSTPSAEMTIAIWSSSEEIKKGQEILVSYGKSWWQARTNIE